MLRNKAEAPHIENINPDFITRLKNSVTLGIFQWIWILAIVMVLSWYIDRNWGEFKNYDWQLHPLWLIAAAVAAALRKLLGGLRWVLIGIYPSVNADSKEVLGHLKVYFLFNMAIYITGNVWFIANAAVVLVLSTSIWVLLSINLVCIINSLLPFEGIDAIYITSVVAISWVVGFFTPWAPHRAWGGRKAF